jgi:hypothetical protein
MGTNPPLISGVEFSQAERLAEAALEEPSPHAAIRLLTSFLPEIETDLPGVRNVGMLALHELKHGVPARPDWQAAVQKARGVLSLEGADLIEGLGFEIEPHTTFASILRAGGTDHAVAVFLNEDETFEDPGNRFDGSTPLSRAIALADQRRLPWVVITRGRQIRLYSARPNIGVGQKGRAETFIELNLALLPENLAGYLTLIFGPEALAEGGSLEDILEASQRFSSDLGARLRERVYQEVVPALATAVGRRMGNTQSLSRQDLDAAYEQTLMILFRILFVAYAEDRDLLPYRSNSLYADHSLKRIAQRLAEFSGDQGTGFDQTAASLWRDVKELWDAVNQGNATWQVPAYDGGLFSSDPDVNKAGAAIESIELSDAEFGPALTKLLVDEGTDGVRGPVDFRSLSVREFGTIYEGLLESQLSVAQSDLTVDASGNFAPAADEVDVAVEEGELYVHNRSGARKSTGSFFTPDFAVDHLLDNALEPALEEHIKTLISLIEDGDEQRAAEMFFDFRCADIAMGSGHFLVAAIDRIEAKLSEFLANYPIPQVIAELERLREAAYRALGELGSAYEIERSALLRRMVARRCIYGVDVNRIAVELARLAVWVHTFVPGLPLSFLDHNLVWGNSLTGVGTLDEVVDVLDPQSKPGVVSLARTSIEDFLKRAKQALGRLAKTTEATVTEIEDARKAHIEAMAAVEPARMLFDLVVAARMGEAEPPGAAGTAIDEEILASSPDLERARQVSKELQAIHFPVAFPEVFLRNNPGFDCIVGNPPWEEATVEKLGFWAIRYPGLKSLSAAKQQRELARLERLRPDIVDEYESELAEAELLRKALTSGPYPGMGSGDPDVYKAFCWRFWDLCRQGGRIGVVLPRSALSAKGSEQWRMKILDEGAFEDVTFLLNTAGWVFEDAEHRYTIALVSVRKGKAGQLVKLRGPFASLGSYRAGSTKEPVAIPVEDFKSWSEGASFPLLPSQKSLEVFLKLRAHPRLDGSDLPRERESWRARPATELHATNDKHLFVLDR